MQGCSFNLICSLKRAPYFAYLLLTHTTEPASSSLLSDIPTTRLTHAVHIPPEKRVKDPRRHRIWLSQCEASVTCQVECKLIPRIFPHKQNTFTYMGSALANRCKHVQSIFGALSRRGDLGLISPRLTQRDTWKTLQFHCGKHQGHLPPKTQSDKKSNLGVMEQRGWKSRRLERNGIPHYWL